MTRADPDDDPWAGTGTSKDFLPPEDLISPNGKIPAGELVRTDLAKILADGIPLPVLMCNSLLYEGGLHSVTGPPDCGKSWFLCWAALQIIRDGGEFVLLDEESGAAQYAEKMAGLGATEDELQHLWYYGFPGRAWDAADIAVLAQLLATVQPKIIGWDSSAAFLARAGLDENAAGDITRFWSQVLTPCARDHGAAVLVADHDVKSTTSTRYARGSGAKLASVDVAIKLEAITPFSRDSAGTLKLTVTKDRRGWLHRYHRIEVTPGPVLLFEPRPVGQDEALASELTPTQQAVLDVLSASPQTVDRIAELTSQRTGTKNGRQVVSKALWSLADLHLADRMDCGPGVPSYWSRP